MKSVRVGDPLVITTVVLIFLIGVFVLYTTSPVGALVTNWVESLVIKQLLFGLLSVLVIIGISNIDLQITKTPIVQFMVISVVIISLAGLFFLGPIVNATHRWYKIGQFLVQPSEFAKIALSLWTAFWVTSENIKPRYRVLFGVGGVLGTISLIILQPDFGATIISLLIFGTIFILWLIKYEVGRSLVYWFVSSTVIGVLGLILSKWILIALLIPLFMLVKQNWKVGLVACLMMSVLVVSALGIATLWNTNVIPQYVKDRLESFSGTQEESFQIRQSKIAIGSGGVFGKGISQGTQSRLRFLPEYTTDFIFAAFVEERGFAGMLLLISLYLILFGRLIFIALQVKDEYSRLLIIGLTVKLWFETFVNMGMNMGVLPTKGVALPFMSYGGSSLLANSIIVGIILSLYRFEAKRDTISSSFGLA